MPAAAPGVENPVDDPDVTAVGGTNLITTAPIATLVDQYVGENSQGDQLVSPFDLFGISPSGADSCGMTGCYWGPGGSSAPASLTCFNRNITGFSGYWDNNPTLAHSYVLGLGTPNVTSLPGLQGAVPSGNPNTFINP